MMLHFQGIHTRSQNKKYTSNYKPLFTKSQIYVPHTAPPTFY